MNLGAALRHLLLVLELGECSDLGSRWEEGLIGRCRGEGLALRPELLFSPPSDAPRGHSGERSGVGEGGRHSRAAVQWFRGAEHSLQLDAVHGQDPGASDQLLDHR